MSNVEVALTVVSVVVAVFTLIYTLVRAWERAVIKEVNRESNQNQIISEISQSLEGEMEKVKELNLKMEDLRDGAHESDVKISEMKAIQNHMLTAVMSIESDIKELISIVGRGG